MDEPRTAARATDPEDAFRAVRVGDAVPGGSLPKGGGAIRAIGEKFAADPARGTGRMTVPLTLSAARDLTPALTLTYDSGAGNGPFGMGWQLSLPAVTRRTDNGLPRYLDDDPDAETTADVFLLTGADDLVPVPPGPDGDGTAHPGYRVRRYRPRVEGDFTRIERWTRTADGDVHWRTLSADNLLNVYGRDTASRIADPADPRRVFGWLLCETRDDRGNAVHYRYLAEDATGVDRTAPHERGRGAADDPRRHVARYPYSVRYGNRVPLLDADGRRPVDVSAEQLRDARWMFELVLDYGGHDDAAPTPAPTGPWACRADPFSTHRPGFEVRTYRLCRRALMFHHFPGEPGVGADCLVAATAFGYRAGPDAQGVPGDTARGHVGGSFLESVTVSGFRRAPGGGYTTRSLPPLTFTYTRAEIDTRVRRLDAGSLENLPAGLDETAYDWVDLDGEGLSGALSVRDDAWYYKPNLGGGSLGPLRRLATLPSPPAGPGRELTDLDGAGTPALVKTRTAPARRASHAPAAPPARSRRPRAGSAPGWTAATNKGLPVKQYEPYFSPTHEYDPEEAMVGDQPGPGGVAHGLNLYRNRRQQPGDVSPTPDGHWQKRKPAARRPQPGGHGRTPRQAAQGTQGTGTDRSGLREDPAAEQPPAPVHPVLAEDLEHQVGAVLLGAAELVRAVADLVPPVAQLRPAERLLAAQVPARRPARRRPRSAAPVRSRTSPYTRSGRRAGSRSTVRSMTVSSSSSSYGLSPSCSSPSNALTRHRNRGLPPPCRRPVPGRRRRSGRPRRWSRVPRPRAPARSSRS
ncbi:hypothetical protein SFUMM280S_02418 [Streptomyces fumanus]